MSGTYRATLRGCWGTIHDFLRRYPTRGPDSLKGQRARLDYAFFRDAERRLNRLLSDFDRPFRIRVQFVKSFRRWRVLRLPVN